MKKIILMLPALALALASCGPSGSQPPVDPLSLSFTGTGTADWAGNAPITLTDTFSGVQQNIGTLNPDKSVNITISPDKVRNFKLNSLANYNTFTDCDRSGLKISQNANYYDFLSADFMDGSTKSYLRPGTKIANANGTISYTDHQFWYLDQATTLTGTVKCSNDNINLNLNLKPGWNHIVETYTYDPTTKMYVNDNMTVADYSNVYNGSWMAYDY